MKADTRKRSLWWNKFLLVILLTSMEISVEQFILLVKWLAGGSVLDEGKGVFLFHRIPSFFPWFRGTV